MPTLIKITIIVITVSVIIYYFHPIAVKKVTFDDNVKVITFQKEIPDELFDNIKQIEKFTQGGVKSKYIDESKYIEGAEYV